MTEWEHKITIWEEPPLVDTSMGEAHRRQAEMMLNRFGLEGWELVALRYLNSMTPHPMVWAVWKRPKSDK